MNSSILVIKNVAIMSEYNQHSSKDDWFWFMRNVFIESGSKKSDMIHVFLSHLGESKTLHKLHLIKKKIMRYMVKILKESSKKFEIELTELTKNRIKNLEHDLDNFGFVNNKYMDSAVGAFYRARMIEKETVEIQIEEKEHINFYEKSIDPEFIKIMQGFLIATRYREEDPYFENELKIAREILIKRKEEISDYFFSEVETLSIKALEVFDY